MFKGVGVIDGQEMVKGRFTLTRYNLRDKNPELHATDASIVAGLRDLYATLRKGSVGAERSRGGRSAPRFHARSRPVDGHVDRRTPASALIGPLRTS